MIPSLITNNGIWNVLPPGVHECSYSEIEDVFGYNNTRRDLLSGLKVGLEQLSKAGCRVCYIDGSFVTSKPIPGDFDACWDHVGIDVALLNPVFLDFSNKRAAQKSIFLGEFFPAMGCAEPGFNYLNFFQKDKANGETKGILKVTLPDGLTN